MTDANAMRACALSLFDRWLRPVRTRRSALLPHPLGTSHWISTGSRPAATCEKFAAVLLGFCPDIAAQQLPCSLEELRDEMHGAFAENLASFDLLARSRASV